MKNCLVTGGAGFIGSHLVHALIAQGCTVRILDDLSSGKRDNLADLADRVDFREGSVANVDDALAAVAGCDTVFHLAAIPSVTKSVEDPATSHEVTATGTVRILDAARKAGVKRLVFASSSAAYGDQPGRQRDENDLLIPLSPYAAAKLSGEHYCSCFNTVYGLETVRLRFFNVFGPKQDAKSPYSGVIALFIAAMSQGKRPTIYGDGLQSRDFVYIDNVVQALTLAATVPGVSGHVYNVGCGGSITVLDLVAHVNALLGTDIQPILAPARDGDIRHSEANIARIRKDLGYDPKIPFREGLAHTLNSQLGR
jgi:UDP-glucose 4-epimerase